MASTSTTYEEFTTGTSSITSSGKVAAVSFADVVV